MAKPANNHPFKGRAAVGEERRRKFLAALQVMPSIRKACEAAEVDRGSLSRERNANPEFESQIQAILTERDEHAQDVLLENMLRYDDWMIAKTWLAYSLQRKKIETDRDTKTNGNDALDKIADAISNRRRERQTLSE